MCVCMRLSSKLHTFQYNTCIVAYKLTYNLLWLQKQLGQGFIKRGLLRILYYKTFAKFMLTALVISGHNGNGGMLAIVHHPTVNVIATLPRHRGSKSKWLVHHWPPDLRPRDYFWSDRGHVLLRRQLVAGHRPLQHHRRGDAARHQQHPAHRSASSKAPYEDPHKSS